MNTLYDQICAMLPRDGAYDGRIARLQGLDEAQLEQVFDSLRAVAEPEIVDAPEQAGIGLGDDGSLPMFLVSHQATLAHNDDVSIGEDGLDVPDWREDAVPPPAVRMSAAWERLRRGGIKAGLAKATGRVGRATSHLVPAAMVAGVASLLVFGGVTKSRTLEAAPRVAGKFMGDSLATSRNPQRFAKAQPMGRMDVPVAVVQPVTIDPKAEQQGAGTQAVAEPVPVKPVTFKVAAVSKVSMRDVLAPAVAKAPAAALRTSLKMRIAGMGAATLLTPVWGGTNIKARELDSPATEITAHEVAHAVAEVAPHSHSKKTRASHRRKHRKAHTKVVEMEPGYPATDLGGVVGGVYSR